MGRVNVFLKDELLEPKNEEEQEEKTNRNSFRSTSIGSQRWMVFEEIRKTL